uniref:Uncharacterized protein n=1 Tax=Triticum urartu TaxID=4572 RepID=A0A8R7QUH6_TRIUA
MESQSISTDGYLRRWKVSDSSHGASVKSSFSISGTGGVDPADAESSPSVDAEHLGDSGSEFLDEGAARDSQMAVSLASTEAWSGPARWAPPRRSDGKLRRARSPRRRKAALS